MITAAGISSLRLLLQLLGWRLRFYANSTLKLVNRRWQILLLMLLTLSPASMPLAAQIQAVAAPVRQIVAGGNAIYSLNIWLIGLLLMSAWVTVQTEALLGGAAWRYMRTLPAVNKLATAVDLVLLLIADLPLLLPFLAYAISAAPSDRAENIVLVSALALQWPLYQHLLLRRSSAALIVAAATLAAILLLCREEGRLPAIGLITAGSLAGLMLNKHLPVWTGLKPPTSWLPKIKPQQRPLTNLIGMNLKALTQGSRWPQWATVIGYAAGIFWFASVWREVGFQTPVAAALLIASLLPPLFQIADWQTCLRTVRQPLLPLLASLGLSRRTLLIADMLVLETGFCLLAAPSVIALFSVATWRGVLLLPLGWVSLTLLLPLYAHGNPSRLLPKLSIAVTFLLAAWSVIQT